MEDFNEKLFVSLIRDLLEKSLKINLEDSENLTYGDYLTISDLIEEEIGETCNHRTLEKYFSKARSADVSNLSKGVVDVLAAYVLDEENRKPLRKGSSINWVAYGNRSEQTFSTSPRRYKKSRIIFSLILFAGFICSLFLFWKKDSKITVGIAINTHDHQFFQWLESEFEKSCNCDLEYDRELHIDDRRSSRERVTQFLEDKNVEVVFGGSIGIYTDPVLNSEFTTIDNYLQTIRDNGIPYDQRNRKWIGLYQKFQALLYDKSSITPEHLNQYSSLVELAKKEKGFSLLLPTLNRNASLVHHMILNLAHKNGSFDFGNTVNIYIEMLGQNNIYYDEGLYKLKYPHCYILYSKIDGLPYHLHDAMQLLEDDMYRSKLGYHVFANSIPTISCLGILDNANSNTELIHEFMKFVLSSKCQKKLFEETFKIPTNPMAFDDIVASNDLPNIINLPKINYEVNQSVNLVISKLKRELEVDTSYNKINVPSNILESCIK